MYMHSYLKLTGPQVPSPDLATTPCEKASQRRGKPFALSRLARWRLSGHWCALWARKPREMGTLRFEPVNMPAIFSSILSCIIFKQRCLNGSRILLNRLWYTDIYVWIISIGAWTLYFCWWIMMSGNVLASFWGLWNNPWEEYSLTN